MSALEQVLRDLQLQINVADGYAKDARPSSEILPSVWQIQNMHLRDGIERLAALTAALPAPGVDAHCTRCGGSGDDPAMNGSYTPSPCVACGAASAAPAASVPAAAR